MGIQNFFSGGLIKPAIERAVEAGVPAQYLAYLLLLPFLASFIAAGRHLLGLTTYGIFIPAVISVIWLELGLGVGLLVAIFLYLWARLARVIIKKTMIRAFRINYLPRMAVFLLLISLGLLVVGLIPGLSWLFTEKERLFSFLILILVTHHLIETQMSLSQKEARSMLLEMFVFALVGYGLLGWPWLQRVVLAHPGLTILLALAFNIFVGRYTGFRLFEYRRFHWIIKKKE